MKKTISLVLALVLFAALLLGLNNLGTVEGKSYVFARAKCRWEDDIPEWQKEDFVTIMKVLTEDESITTKNVLEKYEEMLNQNNQGRIYTFQPDGIVGGTFSGTWQQEPDGELEVTLMDWEMAVEMKLGRLVQKVRDYDYIDAVLVFKKQ